MQLHCWKSLKSSTYILIENCLPFLSLLIFIKKVIRTPNAPSTFKKSNMTPSWADWTDWSFLHLYLLLSKYAECQIILLRFHQTSCAKNSSRWILGKVPVILKKNESPRLKSFRKKVSNYILQNGLAKNSLLWRSCP